MPDRLQLTDTNRSAVVTQFVAVLEGGGLVRVRLLEGDWAMASACDAAAVDRFARQRPPRPAALMLYDRDAAADHFTTFPESVKRLMRGGCPLIIAADERELDESLLESLPAMTRAQVLHSGRFHLAPPPGPVIREVLCHLSAPLIVCHPDAGTGSELYDMLIRDSSQSPPAPGVVEVNGDRWELSDSGSITAADVQRIMAKRIVFVCTGNTCRSPMAEVMFRTMLAERLGCAPADLPQHGYHVASAGLAAMSGAPASPESVDLCAEQGIDLTSHSSQPLTETLIDEADRLYTMTAGHREAILSSFPELSDRVEVLSRNGHDVTDPIGCGRAAYEQAYAEITENLRALVDELTQASNSRRTDAES